MRLTILECSTDHHLAIEDSPHYGRRMTDGLMALHGKRVFFLIFGRRRRGYWLTNVHWGGSLLGASSNLKSLSYPVFWPRLFLVVVSSRSFL